VKGCNAYATNTHGAPTACPTPREH